MLKKMYDAIEKLIKWRYKIFLLLLLVLLTDYIVYITGGTAFAFTHMMYIPIILAALLLNTWGTLGIALLGSVTLGPLMPLNVYESSEQSLSGWILRSLFFIAIGLLISILHRCVRMEYKSQLKKSYEHSVTGYPNVSKLRLDLNELIEKQTRFFMIAFKIINLDEIKSYVDYSVGDQSVHELLENLSCDFGRENVYSIYSNEAAVILQDCDIHEAELKARKFLDRFKEPVMVFKLPVGLMVKGGLVCFPTHGTTADDLLKKLGRTLDQVNKNSEFAVYSKSIAYKTKKNYETAVSLYEAVNQNRFKLVYQPKIELKNNKIVGVEALLRWQGGTKEKMDTASFVKIAEDTGFIKELTKWVVKNSIDQIKIWQDQGLKIKVAINISSKDLNDSSLIWYTADCIKSSKIEPDSLEFELTERTLVENENKAGSILKEVKSNGLNISLDDFGTGYNSLVHLVRLPIDNVKIDKSFIDHLESAQYKPLVQSIINTVHYLGMRTIAEGVETEKQVKMLKSMGCDIIQGYYFSKPLPPEKIQVFIVEFNQSANRKIFAENV